MTINLSRHQDFWLILFGLVAIDVLNLQRIATAQAPTASEFKRSFSNCKWNSPSFDDCVKNGVNSLRPFFKTGIPAFNITPFDPFFAREVVQTRGGDSLSYTLKLKNVYERGWTDSIITKFRSNPSKRFVQYTQYFPEKALDGEYQFEGKAGVSTMANAGRWNLTLYNYIQTTTMSKPPKADRIKVRIEIQQIGNMDLHIGNLLRGRTLMENMLDRMINTAWRPGFAVIRPLINDIVSTAFTGIFNDVFNEFDVHEIIPNDIV
ncbi:Haemolymph juvenile hormone Hypothetical protein protein (JHBP) [Nesidiocoris tenuis]|uniref:Hemolymph juvenile hormone-binding protein n=1 Tax=Nesidiocoris tenuis TaxID=355587 RepID=A0ABN7B1G3_9HEMI|nr:Haemolymph juvenile hormone Hypothetical protein protein (JHBP) [Nesidiocoris tenuis]